MVPGARIELATPAFSGRRSTSELPRHANNFSSLGMSRKAVNSPPAAILRPGLQRNAAPRQSPKESLPIAKATSGQQFPSPALAETPKVEKVPTIDQPLTQRSAKISATTHSGPANTAPCKHSPALRRPGKRDAKETSDGHHLALRQASADENASTGR